MLDRRIWGVVLALLLAGGCNSQPKPGVSHLAGKDRPILPMAEPQWGAGDLPGDSHRPHSGAAPDLLASKTAEFANSLDGTETPNSSDLRDGVKLANKSKQSDRTSRQNRDSGDPLTTPAPILTPSLRPSNDPPSLSKTNALAPSAVRETVQSSVNPQLAGARFSLRGNSLNEGPKEVPESEDYLSGGTSGDVLGQRLLKKVRDNPRDIADQLDLQLYGMLNDNPSPELATMMAMPAEDRELVSALVDGLSNFRSTVRQDANMLPEQRLRPLQDMIERLRSQADLTVSNIALCTRVNAFGKYDPIVPPRLQAMHKRQLIVYCEVENFLARQNNRQIWETNLTQQVTLYTKTGLVIWTDDKQKITDECRNRRHDFYTLDIINLPGSLTVGDYVMKVSINDENADRVAEATMNVAVTVQE